jgi:hypothetical protein
VAGRRTDAGELAAGVLYLAVAALFLYTATTGTELLPFAHQVAAFALGLILVALVRGLFRTRR